MWVGWGPLSRGTGTKIKHHFMTFMAVVLQVEATATNIDWYFMTLLAVALRAEGQLPTLIGTL